MSFARRVFSRAIPFFFGAFLPLLISCPGQAEANTSAERELPGEIAVFNLRYLDAEAANIALRGLLNIRRVSVDTERHRIIVSDSAPQVEQARRLIESLDLPPAAWNATIIAVGPEESTVLRSVPLQQEYFRVAFGSSEPNRDSVQLDLRVDEVRSGLLRFHYQVHAYVSPHRGTPLQFHESGEETTDDGEQVLLVSSRLPEHQTALASLLGVPHPVREVVVRLTPQPSKARAASQ